MTFWASVGIGFTEIKIKSLDKTMKTLLLFIDFTIQLATFGNEFKQYTCGMIDSRLICKFYAYPKQAWNC